VTPKSVAWRWSGPPALEIELVEVDNLGHQWVQVVMTAQDGLPGVVVIAERDGCIALVKQYRVTAGTHMWELPRGFGEKIDTEGGKDAASQARRAAHRELAEETGMRLRDARFLGDFFPDSGLLANSVSVVHGYVATDSVGRDVDEIDEILWVETAKIGELIADGTLHDGVTLSALAVWRLGRIRA